MIRALTALALVAGCAAGHTPHSATPSTPAASAPAANDCPRDLDAIRGSDADRAYLAVLQHDHATAAQLTRRSVVVATHSAARGGPVGFACGAQTAARTFVVQADWADAHGSASLQQHVAYVGHRGDSWFVWAEPH